MRRRGRSARHSAGGAAIILSLAWTGVNARAQTRTWDGGGVGNNWATAGNWSSNDVPDSTSEAALFTNDPVGQTKAAVNLSADVTIGQLQFSAAAPSYTIASSGNFTLGLSPAGSFGNVGISVAGGAADQTISAYEVYLASSQTWDIGGTTTLLVSGTIEDPAAPDYGITKNGTGTLVMPGDVRNDGATIINAGEFVLSHSNTAMLSAFTVNGGILRATTDAAALGSNSTRNTVTLAGGALELASDTAGLAFNRNTTVSGNATIRSDRLSAGNGWTQTMGTLKIGAQTMTVAPGANVNSGTAGIAFGATTLSGNATFEIVNGGSASAQLTLGAIGQTGGARSLAKTGSGTLLLAGNNTFTGGVSVNAGTLVVGASTGTNVLNSVAVTGGKLDLQNNKLIVKGSAGGGTGALGTWNGSAYNGMTGLVASGRNGGGWNGSGIVTSQSNASAMKSLTTLAVATADQIGRVGQSFGGKTVGTGDVLVMYTYAGDANLSGAINGDDYFRIDTGYAAHLTGYFNGDFNYDGVINADDYFLIDRNYAEQTSAFSSSEPLDFAAVPEPGGVAIVGIAIVGVSKRRRH